jgi:hypothetical protein
MAARLTRWRATIESGARRVGDLTDGTRSLIVVGVVAVVAGLIRLIGLASQTPGFRIEEATQGLMARRVDRDNLPIFFGHEQDAAVPFFPYLVKVTGSLAGWGVTGPRLAAAICGIGVAVFCALWLGRALGQWWGLAGGLLAATSFWQVLFSRQAVAPISAAMFAALGLWLAWEGLRRGRLPQPDRLWKRADLRWYITSGIAFGLGFLSDASYTIVPPLVLLSAGVLALGQQRARRDADVLGPALMLLTMLVVMTPLAGYFLDNPEDFRRNLDLAGGLPADLVDTGDDVGAGFRSAVWRGSDDAALNLPGRALLDPILACWALAGLLAALRHPARALSGIVLIWLALGVFGTSLVGGDNPGLLLPLAPAFVALPLLGMRAAVGLASARGPRLRRFALVVVMSSISASGIWSLYDYFGQWSESEQVYLAMRGDVRDALAALDELPEDDIPIYFMAGDAGRIVRYLAPDRERHDVESRSRLPVSGDEEAYLVAPRSTQPVAQLLDFLAEADLVEIGAGPGTQPAYRIWVAGPRTRELLPYAVPAIPFENGWSLPGFDARAALMLAGEQAEIDVVLLWQVPPDADPFIAEVRLRPPGEQGAPLTTSAEILVEPWKHPPLPGEFVLVHVRLPFPRTQDLIASLQVGLHDPATGELVTALLNEQDGGYAFLNDIQVVLPGQ